MTVQRRLPAIIADFTTYSDTIRLYRLNPDKRLPLFKPGQFLHLAIDEYDPSFNWPESRVFSIATSPGCGDSLEIIISVKGKYTTRMWDELKKGDKVWIKLPYGIFNFDDSLNRDTVLIAGGTGISPFISFLKYSLEKHLDPLTHLYYGVRNENVIIINDLLKECKLKLSNFYDHIYIEEPGATDPGLQFTKGMLPLKEIIEQTKTLDNPAYYLSGPPAMVTAIENELLSNFVPAENIKFDKWE